MKPDLLVVNEMPSEFLDALRKEFNLHLLSRAGDRSALLAEVASCIRGVVTSGSSGVDGNTIAALPRVEIICCMSAGYDKVDMEAARGRQIIVTHGAGINSHSVADNALCLLLAVVRNLVPAVAYVRAGGWPEKGRPPATATITGKKTRDSGSGRHWLSNRQACIRALTWKFRITTGSRATMCPTGTSRHSSNWRSPWTIWWSRSRRPGNPSYGR